MKKQIPFSLVMIYLMTTTLAHPVNMPVGKTDHANRHRGQGRFRYVRRGVYKNIGMYHIQIHSFSCGQSARSFSSE